MVERIARFCVGVGLAWVVLVVFTGLAKGLLWPSTWFPLLDHVVGSSVRWGVYLGLTVVVVPIGMLAYLRDLLRDPLPLGLKAAIPGTFVSVYLLFLACALPDLGGPLLLEADPIAARLVPDLVLGASPDATGSWLVRFGVCLVVLAGIPGLAGALASYVGGLGAPRHR
ncbi:MAG TPA: hypothetical protein VLD61_03630 [Methylomirabilota bacterium]|nr:hypothetical protein [Methylomirabilota bacterium]